jgi:hypothetical protein
VHACMQQRRGLQFLCASNSRLADQWRFDPETFQGAFIVDHAGCLSCTRTAASPPPQPAHKLDRCNYRPLVSTRLPIISRAQIRDDRFAAGAPQAHWRLDSWPHTYEQVRFHARAGYGRC